MTLIGAQMVAKAWSDTGYRSLMLSDAGYAYKQLTGVLPVGADGHPYQLVVFADDATNYNVIVCEPCSCWPIETLGATPAWFKDAAFRAQISSNNQTTMRSFLLSQFALTVPNAMTVWARFSDAERRPMKLPTRPTGTDGWTEAQLTAILTPDMIIGTALVPPQ